jgi:hypothetical protein
MIISMNIDTSIETLQRHEVVRVLRDIEIVQSSLEVNWLGRDGWGDCGQSTWMMVDETPEGESLESNRFFEEEVVHALRHALPMRRHYLDTKTEAIDMLNPVTSNRQEKIDSIGSVQRNLAALALKKLLIIDQDDKGALKVPAALYAASCYYAADITHPDDRFVAGLVGEFNIDSLTVLMETLKELFVADGAKDWWAFVQTNLAIDRLT